MGASETKHEDANEADKHSDDCDVINETDDQDDQDEALLKCAYPFENIILEGGGNKGLAYCGAIRVTY